MTQPYQVWVVDVSYVLVCHRLMYLAVVMDLFARNPICWAMSLSPERQLCGRAFMKAFESRWKLKRVMFQSYQGSH
ncbi:DDE-type integrase/transposase/recombinase [Vibrio vulnificus]|uniref:DDE-type integrase/transposase/recombinase n=1 Tax=Vibrio vulnificus TaxID=672 RepID=UPI003BFA69A2